MKFLDVECRDTAGMQTQVVEKNFSRYSCATFSVELRTCFDIDTNDDTASG